MTPGTVALKATWTESGGKECLPVHSRPPPPGTAALRPAGAFHLLAAFAREQSDPGRFYTLLARDSVALVERHMDLDGRQVVDVGGGAGYFAAAFRDRGAQCLLIEPDPG